MSTIALQPTAKGFSNAVPLRWQWRHLCRKILRAYLTYVPIKIGRYPIMMALHKWLMEPISLQCKTKDRGIMVVDLRDEMQFPIYYNNFEAKYDKIMLSILPGSKTVLDVGGNIGQYALLFAQYAERVFTFEPLPRKISHLAYHIAINQLEDKVELVPKALSNNEGKAKLSLPFDPSNEGTASLMFMADRHNSTLEIDTITLDSFCEVKGIKDIDIIKMDIEGAELFALKGMKNLLCREQKPILIFEMAKSLMQTAGYTAADVIAFLRDFGYAGYKMTKQGLLGPLLSIDPWAENYCFLSSEHLKKPQVKSVLITR